ncbi:hypothetical protein NOR53_2568 [gamma proteobacterium NOR5-3]|nr:hypothetical protein NOR53_2568 [gamma proteobacterium NOR5-3]
MQAKALRRALSGETPRTLTPWEWEEWYAAQGKESEFEYKNSD